MSKENKSSNNSITDIYGRSVNYPTNVNKIATVGSATRICTYAGANDKLVAITESDKADILRPYTLAHEQMFENLPTTNNGNHLNASDIDKEKLLSLHPDVIISSRTADECEKLQNDLKIPVVGVFFQDEIFSDNVYNSIKIVATICDTLEHANKTIEFLENTKTDLEKRTKKSQLKIYRGAINYKGSKNLCGTISNYCVYNAIKIKNIADNPSIESAYDTNLEQIVNWNPDYIFMDYTNLEKIKKQKQDNLEVFSKINAFNNNKAYFVAPFNNNGTNIEYGLCEAYFTASILNQASFKDINLEDKFTEIFKILDGKDIYKDLKNKGIKFETAEL